MNHFSNQDPKHAAHKYKNLAGAITGGKGIFEDTIVNIAPCEDIRLNNHQS